MITIFNIDNNNNNSWSPNQHIRMIPEVSCDTEDWSNDAVNLALHHSNKLHFKLKQKTVIFKCNNI